MPPEIFSLHFSFKPFSSKSDPKEIKGQVYQPIQKEILLAS